MNILEIIKVAHKLNSKELADRLGISPSYLSMIISKERRISPALAKKIKETFPEYNYNNISGSKNYKEI